MTWHDEFFNDPEYETFYRGVLTPERTQKEIEFLTSVFDEDTKSILDMPCGYGRHAIELAKRGYHVTGVDYYDAQVEAAQSKAQNIKNLVFLKKDMRKWSAGGEMDAAINMFSSFGYFGHSDDKSVLSNLVCSVKVRGLVILDVRNPLRVFLELANSNWKIERKNEEGKETEILDPVTLIDSIIYERDDKIKKAEMNLYMPNQLKNMFEEQGAAVEKMYGNYKKEPYNALESPRLIIVARRVR